MKCAKHKAFSLVELLVVLAIISLMLAFLVPSLSRAKLKARKVRIESDLRQVGFALEMYMIDNAGRCPPTRKDCGLYLSDFPLPIELADGGYLPGDEPRTGRVVAMPDPFDKGNSYKYAAVSQLMLNGQFVPKNYKLYVPNGFLSGRETEGQGQSYDDPKQSPVTWVVYSHGPEFDLWEMMQARYPVPRNTWFNWHDKKGLLVRLRTLKGDHLGTYSK